MPFTDRFIRVPIKLVDKKLGELTGGKKLDEEDSYMFINPFNILGYRPAVDKEFPQLGEITLVRDITGDNTYVYMHIDEFEKLLNDHVKAHNIFPHFPN